MEAQRQLSERLGSAGCSKHCMPYCMGPQPGCSCTPQHSQSQIGRRSWDSIAGWKHKGSCLKDEARLGVLSTACPVAWDPTLGVPTHHIVDIITQPYRVMQKSPSKPVNAGILYIAISKSIAVLSPAWCSTTASKLRHSILQ